MASTSAKKQQDPLPAASPQPTDAERRKILDDLARSEAAEGLYDREDETSPAASGNLCTNCGNIYQSENCKNVCGVDDSVAPPAASGSGTATLAPAPNWFPPREEVNDLNTGTSAGVYADGWNDCRDACIKSFRENFITNPGTPATPSAPDDGIVHLQMEPICNHPDCLIAAQAYAAAAVEREREECASIEGRPIPQEQRIAHAEGSLWMAFDPLPLNLPQFEGFEYTGEYRIPATAEWFVADSEHADPAQWDNYENVHPLLNKHGVISQPRYILRKLPAAQEEKP